MPGEIEIELPDPEIKPVTPDKQPDTGKPTIEIEGGGEGGNNKVSAEDLIALRAELDAAKAEAKRAATGEAAASQRAQEVERRATETEGRLSTEIETRLNEQESTVTSAIASAQSEISSIKELQAKAMEEGKWAEVADANEAMADAKLRLRDLTAQKGAITAYREQAKAEAARPKPAQPTVGAKTQAWIAQHPRFNSDAEYRAAAMLGHERAIKQGHPVESEEYFKIVEELTGDRKAAEPEANNDKIERAGGDPPGNKGPGVASVQRRAPSGNGNSNPRTIKLTSDQVEFADSLYGDPTNTLMYIKDPAERYRFWHQSQEKLRSEGRIT